MAAPTRAERNFNPLNVRIEPNTNWAGQVSNHWTDDHFVMFRDPSYGFRAAAIILASYGREGYRTLQSIIQRWAPPTENNTQAYLADVCERTGFPVAYEPLSQSDPAALHALLDAMAWHENGVRWWTDDQIDAGIKMAAAHAA